MLTLVLALALTDPAVPSGPPAAEPPPISSPAPQPDPETDARKRMLDLFKAGKTIPDIVAALEAEGVRRSNGEKWEGDAVRKALRQEVSPAAADDEEKPNPVEAPAAPAQAPTPLREVPKGIDIPSHPFLIGTVGESAGVGLGYWSGHLGVAALAELEYESLSAAGTSVDEHTTAVFGAFGLAGLQLGRMRPSFWLGLGGGVHDSQTNRVTTTRFALLGRVAVDFTVTDSFTLGVAPLTFAVSLSSSVKQQGGPETSVGGASLRLLGGIQATWSW